MRKLMAGLVVAAAWSVTAGVGPAPARADSADIVNGGCISAEQPSPTVGDTHTGVIGDLSATTTGGSLPQPIGASVTCWIEVNGIVAPGTTHTYGDVGAIAGVQAGTDPISYTATDGDVVKLCHAVHFADGTSTAAECPEPKEIYVYPCGQTDVDCLDAMVAFLNNKVINPLYYDYVDPAVCPVLVAHAGSYPGGITIEPDGDVYLPDPFGLGLSPLYDCPPYR